MALSRPTPSPLRLPSTFLSGSPPSPTTTNPRRKSKLHPTTSSSKMVSSRPVRRSTSRKPNREQEELPAVFPNFCSYCEKQIKDGGATFLYCSESCRQQDLHSALSPHRPSSISLHLPPGGPDIIPRASPTLSRPLSYFDDTTSSTNPGSQYSPPSPPSIYSRTAPSSSSTSSALDSLRSLSSALDRERTRQTPVRKSSSSSEDSSSGSGGGNYSSTIRPSGAPRSYSHTPLPGAYGYGNYAVSYSGGMGMDRPLPPRTTQGGFSHRPRSIDLVTPFVGS